MKISEEEEEEEEGRKGKRGTREGNGRPVGSRLITSTPTVYRIKNDDTATYAGIECYYYKFQISSDILVEYSLLPGA